MFVERFTKNDAQALANWLYQDSEACYYPENAMFEMNKNKALYLICDGYENNTKNILLLKDFSIVDFSPCKYMYLDERFREFMAQKFGEEYVSEYHKHIDKQLLKYFSRDLNQ